MNLCCEHRGMKGPAAHVSRRFHVQNSIFERKNRFSLSDEAAEMASRHDCEHADEAVLPLRSVVDSP